MESKVRENEYYVDPSKPWFNEKSGWPEEVPKNIEFPLMSLGEMLARTAEKYPDRKVMWFLDEWMTFGELKKHTDSLATALHASGIGKGDVVALLMPNSFQYVIAYYACVTIGAIPSGINPTYMAQEVLHQIKTVGARAVIFLDALYESILAPILDETDIDLLVVTNVADFMGSKIKKLLGKLLKKIPTGTYPDNALQFTDLLKTPADVPPVEIDPREDVATYIMTGGTTGVPKAAVLTHFNCVSNCIQSAAWLYKGIPGSCAVGVLPLFHSFAMSCVMNISIYYGLWMMLFPRPPKPDELCEQIISLVDEKGAVYCGAEVLFQRLSDFPDIGKYDLAEKFTFCVSGAGPLHRPVQEKFERITGARLVEGFGLTEATPVVSAGAFYGKRKIGTIGLPFPGTEWKIVDKTDYTKELGIGKEEIGEIAIAGPQVMKGYLNRPEETAETIVTIEGKRFLLTGDIGYMDEGGSIVILDRKKQLIKHKGYSVFPKEVEELIGDHESVSEVAVAGLPDEATGEIIKAWVVLRPESRGKITAEELRQWCKDTITHYKVPAQIDFIDELPKTLVGKVLRRVLQEADPIWIAAHKDDG